MVLWYRRYKVSNIARCGVSGHGRTMSNEIVVAKTDYEQHMLDNTVAVTHDHRQTWLLDAARPGTYMWRKLYTSSTLLAARDRVRYLPVTRMEICHIQPDVLAAKKFFRK